MTEKEKEETIKRLKAKLKCLINMTKGTNILCINNKCDECNLNYEQGTLGEQKIDLKRAIEIMENKNDTKINI